MRINTNVPGLRILDQIGRNNRQLNKVVQRLSTGLRVNSAADDVVAMARGQRLASEISGMKQSLLGIEMQQSRINTAEWALTETQNAMQRMRELAVYAASDTVTDEDRAYIQSEIEELTCFINGIVGNSRFNNIKLFRSDLISYFETNAISKITDDKAETEELKGAIGDLMLQNASMNDIYTSIFDLLEKRLQEKIENGELPGGYEDIAFDKEYISVKILGIDDIDVSTQNAAEKNLERMSEALSRIMSYEAIGNEEAKEIEAQLSQNSAVNEMYRSVFDAFERLESERVKEGKEAEEIGRRREEEEDGEQGGNSPKDAFETDPEARAILDELDRLRELPGMDEAILRARAALANIRYGIDAINGTEVSLSGEALEGITPLEGDDDDELDAWGDDRSSGAGALGGIDVSTRESAAKSISLLDSAIGDVSRERASLGAQYNALEHRKSALEIAIINAEETRSRLMDADIALEMMNFAKLSLSNQINGMLLKQTTDMQAQVLNLFM